MSRNPLINKSSALMHFPKNFPPEFTSKPPYPAKDHLKVDYSIKEGRVSPPLECVRLLYAVPLIASTPSPSRRGRLSGRLCTREEAAARNYPCCRGRRCTRR